MRLMGIHYAAECAKSQAAAEIELLMNRLAVA
jgi:hypothetical protein